MELVSGVYTFPQTVTWDETETTIHPAAVETSKGVLLLDTGFTGLTDQIEDNLADVGLDWEAVSGIVITHHDSDHAGSLATVVDRTDAIVCAHGECAPYVDGRKDPLKSPEGERYPPADVDIELVDGVSFNTVVGPMEVLHTPGHTPGHISLHFPDEELLIAADALTADDDRLYGPNEQYTPDMDRALTSVKSLSERQISRTLCYHGGFVDDGATRIAELVDDVA